MPKRRYRVKWEIQVEASSHEEAAAIAAATVRDPQNDAVTFEVLSSLEKGFPHYPNWKQVEVPWQEAELREMLVLPIEGHRCPECKWYLDKHHPNCPIDRLNYEVWKKDQ